MRIGLATYGSTGDVLPVGILSRALSAAGHEVRLLVPPERVASFDDLEARPLGEPLTAWFERPLSMKSRRETARFLAFLRRQGASQRKTLVDAFAGFDIVVGAGLIFPLPAAMRAVGVRHAFLGLCPHVVPGTDLPPPLWAGAMLPKIAVRAAWGIGSVFVRAVFRASYRELMGAAILLAVDEALAPVPRGCMRVLSVGPLVPPMGTLPEAVGSFVAAKACAWMGLGSMSTASPHAVSAALVAAAREVGLAVLLQSGAAGLEPPDAGDDVLGVGFVPHGALLPHVAVAVHHGGAGTVAAAARAGIPQVVIPHVFDQPWWARRVAELGVGVVVPPNALCASEVTRALKRCSEPAMRERARALAARMSCGNPAIAVNAIEGLAR